MMHKGWYSRGYLPHCDNPELLQMVTFRLTDAMPSNLLRYWKRLLEKKNDPELWDKVEKKGSIAFRVGRIVSHLYVME